MWQPPFTNLHGSGTNFLASNEFFIFNGISIEKKIISQDIRSLVLSYLSLNTTSFKPFQSLWLERGFSLVHYICPQKYLKESFLEFIYSEILSYLLVSNSIAGRVSVVYALFLLRHSEPIEASSGTMHIPILITSLVIFTELKESFDLFASERLLEPLYVLRFLFKSNSFVYIRNYSSLLSIDNSLAAFACSNTTCLPSSTVSKTVSTSIEKRDSQQQTFFDNQENIQILESSDFESLETSSGMYKLLKRHLATLLPEGQIPENLSLYDPLFTEKLRSIQSDL